MEILYRSFLALVLSTGLTGCLQSDEQVPLSTIEQLNGTWLQEQGPGKLVFYMDETVKLSLPQYKPGIKIVSGYEQMSDNAIGISIGDRWLGPVKFYLEENRIRMAFPAENPQDEATMIYFTRQAKSAS